jgi:hypothetical protein
MADPSRTGKTKAAPAAQEPNFLCKSAMDRRTPHQGLAIQLTTHNTVAPTVTRQMRTP